MLIRFESGIINIMQTTINIMLSYPRAFHIDHVLAMFNGLVETNEQVSRDQVSQRMAIIARERPTQFKRISGGWYRVVDGTTHK